MSSRSLPASRVLTKSPAKGARRRIPLAAVFAAALGLLLLSVVASLALGSINIDPAEVIEALLNPAKSSYEHTVITGLRLPRTVFAVVVGAGLGVSGAVMQAVTRNPLADPFVFGISSGAALGITSAVFFAALHSPEQFVWFAFAGALGSAVLVYLIGQGGGPVRLVLAGVITSTLMSTWTAVLIHTDMRTRETVRYVLIGSVSGRQLADFWLPLSCVVVGTLCLLRLGHQLNLLSLGEDTARAAGMNTAKVRLLCTGLVVLVAGAAVAAAGPIGFVGFAVPHAVRVFTGPDYRAVLLGSALLGATLLLLADLLGRFALHPAELEASIVMGVLGAPLFILAARRKTTSP